MPKTRKYDRLRMQLRVASRVGDRRREEALTYLVEHGLKGGRNSLNLKEAAMIYAALHHITVIASISKIINYKQSLARAKERRNASRKSI